MYCKCHRNRIVTNNKHNDVKLKNRDKEEYYISTSNDNNNTTWLYSRKKTSRKNKGNNVQMSP